MRADQDAIGSRRMYAELAQYIAPKRKSIEHSGSVDAPQFVIMGAQPDATAEDWERRNNPDPKDKLQ